MCNEEEAKGMSRLDDLAELNLVDEYADDMETILTSGNITLKIDVDPKTPVPFHTEIFKWERGTWVNSIFSLYRPDLCACLFSPTEIWYELAKQLPPKDRTCPPPKGHVFQLQNFSNRIELPNMSLLGDFSGKYKSIVHFKIANYTLCTSCTVDVWKS
ncbi:uncharacterized protein LOC106095641 [Stomoxys calcitrans]|uniref:uncharacterized protein LOC106095641 n=1 Tax=Stomoxys calcitrans TaxID=35570 RepID=UPI0027E26D54|nr:uncharacterized protein LOC106095641 [Stomoxys calcitrans]